MSINRVRYMSMYSSAVLKVSRGGMSMVPRYETFILGVYRLQTPANLKTGSFAGCWPHAHPRNMYAFTTDRRDASHDGVVFTCRLATTAAVRACEVLGYKIVSKVSTYWKDRTLFIINGVWYYYSCSAGYRIEIFDIYGNIEILLTVCYIWMSYRKFRCVEISNC